MNLIATPGAGGGKVVADLSGAPDFSISVPSGGQSGSAAQFDVAAGSITPLFVSYTPSQPSVQQVRSASPCRARRAARSPVRSPFAGQGAPPREWQSAPC